MDLGYLSNLFKPAWKKSLEPTLEEARRRAIPIGQDTIGSPSNRVDPLSLGGIPEEPRARRNDISLDGPTWKAPSATDKFRDFMESLGGAVKQNPAVRIASDASNAYNEFLGSPLENVNPAAGASKAVGVMLPYVRKSARKFNIPRMRRIVSELGSNEPAAHGFRQSLDDLMNSHPRLMTELDKVELKANRGPDDRTLGNFTSGRGNSFIGSIKEANDNQSMLNERTVWDMADKGMDPNWLELRRISGIGRTGTARVDPIAVNNIFKDYSPAEYSNIVKHIRGQKTGIHEVTHHAQDLISKTGSREKTHTQDIISNLGKELYWLAPDEIGARATANRRLSRTKGKSYLDDVIKEINNTLISNELSGVSDDRLRKWADTILPEMSDRYGVEILPSYFQGSLSRVSRGKKLPSRIFQGQPISKESASKLRELNGNNFSTKTGYLNEDKAAKSNDFDANKWLEDFDSFVKNKGRGSDVIDPRARGSKNFIGQINHNGGIDVRDLGQFSPMMAQHSDQGFGSGGARFRYENGTITWTGPFSPDDYFAAEDYFTKHGMPVIGHNDLATGNRVYPPTPDYFIKQLDAVKDVPVKKKKKTGR